ncbi:MAG: citrate/2-methylcitrate synthase, partial [bacterium]
MSTIKEALSQKIPGIREEIKKLVKEHGTTKISEVTLAQAYGGMRGVKSLVCDTSEVDNNRGVIIGGIHISELTEKQPEEILWLLLTGELPDSRSLETLKAELQKRSTTVPQYVWDVLKAMPKDSHPMTMFSTAILVMDKDSHFKKRYDQGMRKEEYLEP